MRCTACKRQCVHRRGRGSPEPGRTSAACTCASHWRILACRGPQNPEAAQDRATQEGPQAGGG
eukprot:8155536-Alexandrium_andersonii.AAC.1